MVTADIIGWIGMVCLVGAYGLVSARGKAPGLGFQIFNFCGAAGLVVNSAYYGAWPSVGLNIMWLSIGAITITRLLLTRRKLAAQKLDRAAEDSRPGGAAVGADTNEGNGVSETVQA